MDITFGEYVRQKRLERKITLRTFAKQVGISATFISGMESNEKSAPSGEVLKSIAEVSMTVIKCKKTAVKFCSFMAAVK